MKQVLHEVDFCVVGGGMAGLCAALAAARRGVKVALIQDRPVLGGNASSEIRMHICGAHGPYNRETGIVEEIKLDNRYRNPLGNYSLWDSVLYEKARFEPNIVLLLNCSVCDLELRGSRIVSVKGWQLTTYTWHTVKATLFADCSGDSILAEMSGAEHRRGREAGGEHGESIAPDAKDGRTMGMSCLIQPRETTVKHEFIAPPWAYRYGEDGALPDRDHRVEGTQNFWWIEVGGMQDSIHDTEELRDELQKIVYGVWDHIKNREDHGADRWVLDWVGSLPGKRESRRYVGDHVLTQNDVEAEGRHFEDIVAYGGWTMDDHFPEGFYKKEAGTIFHPAPSPYGIPYRSLYSKNIDNLLFAGRNLSATHTALSSTRVMGTCSVLGQAVGTAAFVACRHGCTPRDVYAAHLDELQLSLMEDDCYLPFTKRPVRSLTAEATLISEGGESGGGSADERLEVLRNGYDRPVGGEDNGLHLPLRRWVGYALAAARRVEQVRIVFDNDLFDETDGRMPSYYSLEADTGAVPSRLTPLPASLVKSFLVEIRRPDGAWHVAADVVDNHQRLIHVPVEEEVRAVRVTPRATYGAPEARIFALDLM